MNRPAALLCLPESREYFIRAVPLGRSWDQSRQLPACKYQAFLFDGEYSHEERYTDTHLVYPDSWRKVP